MKLYDILFNIDIHTKIKVFVDDTKIGILYISPLSSALYKKRYLNINNIYVSNNILVFHTSSNNQQSHIENNCYINLNNILPFIKNKEHVKIFFNDTQIISKQKYLNNTINKIFVKDNYINIILQ